jgi:hypothetical protein
MRLQPHHRGDTSSMLSVTGAKFDDPFTFSQDSRAFDFQTARAASNRGSGSGSGDTIEAFKSKPTVTTLDLSSDCGIFALHGIGAINCSAPSRLLARFNWHYRSGG